MYVHVYVRTYVRTYVHGTTAAPVGKLTVGARGNVTGGKVTQIHLPGRQPDVGDRVVDV